MRNYLGKGKFIFGIIPKDIFLWLLIPIEILFLVFCAYLGKIKKKISTQSNDKKVILGSVPLTNNVYWRDSIRKFTKAYTFTSSLYKIHNREDWDFISSEKFKKLPNRIKEVISVCEALIFYDVIVCSYEGFFLNAKKYWKIQATIFRLSGIKTIIIPYGSDAYDYSTVSSPLLLTGLMASYGENAKKRREIRARIDYWNRYGDVVIPGFMGFDGLGRWEILTCSPLVIDTEFWSPHIKKKELINENNPSIIIGHYPNHPTFKGTDILIAAVNLLQNEGYRVELKIIEGKSKYEIRHFLQKEIDILFDQIYFTGYGLTALEGMACGLPVIGNLSNSIYTESFVLNSFLSECPIVSASPWNLVDKLKILINSPELRENLGKKGREYVENYHSLEAGTHMFKKIFEHLFDNKELPIYLYKPDLLEILNKRDLL